VFVWVSRTPHDFICVLSNSQRVNNCVCCGPVCLYVCPDQFAHIYIVLYRMYFLSLFHSQYPLQLSRPGMAYNTIILTQLFTSCKVIRSFLFALPTYIVRNLIKYFVIAMCSWFTTVHIYHLFVSLESIFTDWLLSQ